MQGSSVEAGVKYSESPFVLHVPATAGLTRGRRRTSLFSMRTHLLEGNASGVVIADVLKLDCVSPPE